jgi:hypothetical protein
LGRNLDETLEAIQKISHEGMVPLDKTVLDLMLEKSRDPQFEVKAAVPKSCILEQSRLVDSDRDLMIV